MSILPTNKKLSALKLIILTWCSFSLCFQSFGYLVPPCESDWVLGVVLDSCSFPQHNSRDKPNSTRLTVRVTSLSIWTCVGKAYDEELCGGALSVITDDVHSCDLVFTLHVFNRCTVFHNNLLSFKPMETRQNLMPETQARSFSSVYFKLAISLSDHALVLFVLYLLTGHVRWTVVSTAVCK